MRLILDLFSVYLDLELWEELKMKKFHKLLIILKILILQFAFINLLINHLF